MKHLNDQDLLLLSHNELGLFRSIRAQMHLRGCKDCKRRYVGIWTVSTAVATAIRVGLPAWKPGVAGTVKLLIGLTVAAAGVLCAEIVVANYTPPAVVDTAQVPVAGESCKTYIPATAVRGEIKGNKTPNLQRVKFPTSKR